MHTYTIYSLLCFKDYSVKNVYSFYGPFSISLVTGWVYEEDPETNVRKWIRTPDDQPKPIFTSEKKNLKRNQEINSFIREHNVYNFIKITDR